MARRLQCMGKFGSSQPDWNQNNPEAADYVKNRPFWTGDPVETVLFDGTLENDSDTERPELTIGQEYTVTFDGTAYVLTAWDDGEGAVILGSNSLWWGEDYIDTEPPFVWGSFWFYTVNEGEQHTLKIVANLGEVHKIPSKYVDLPAPFGVIYDYDVETDEFVNYPAQTLNIYEFGFSNPLNNGRTNVIETDGWNLILPAENFAYCAMADIQYVLDVRNLAKGESAVVSIYKNKNNTLFNEFAKSYNDFYSFISVRVRDTDGVVGAIAHGYNGGAVITPNGKMCGISASRQGAGTDDDRIEIKATVIGILSMT